MSSPDPKVIKPFSCLIWGVVGCGEGVVFLS